MASDEGGGVGGQYRKSNQRAVTNGSKALAERGSAERLEASVNRILFYHKHTIAP